MTPMDDQHPELRATTPAGPIREEPRPLGLAVAAGLAAAVVGAVVWAFVVKLSDYEVGIVAWGIGLLVGVTVAGVSRARGPDPLSRPRAQVQAQVLARPAAAHATR